MGTRSGDLDPGVLSYLIQARGLTPARVHHMVNHESGLLGVSDSSADMRDLLAQEDRDVRAAEAVGLFCYQVRKGIGALAAALGGVDTLVFAGGIGEHAAQVRARVCAELSFLGIELDASLNAASAAVISASASRPIVRVIRTDEELMIARSVLGAVLRSDGGGTARPCGGGRTIMTGPTDAVRCGLLASQAMTAGQE